MGLKLYDEYVEVNGELRDYLKDVMSNHVHIYNLGLNLLKNNPNLTFDQLKKQVRELIAEGSYQVYIEPILFNEMYYLFKRFKKNEATKKKVSGVGYLSFHTTRYTNELFVHNSFVDEFTMRNKEGCIKLPKALPKLQHGKVYLNLSYGGDTEKFKLSVFT